MADLKLIVTDDGEGYYLTDGNAESEAADWSVAIEFEGIRYLGETDGENATLSIVTALGANQYDCEEEGDDEEEDEEEHEGAEEIETEK